MTINAWYALIGKLSSSPKLFAFSSPMVITFAISWNERQYRIDTGVVTRQSAYLSVRYNLHRVLVYIHIYVYTWVRNGKRNKGGAMAGKRCPSCGAFTFFETASGRKCTKCGYEMILPVNEGKGGKGSKCANCNRYTVFHGVCSNCGARYR